MLVPLEGLPRLCTRIALGPLRVYLIQYRVVVLPNACTDVVEPVPTRAGAFMPVTPRASDAGSSTAMGSAGSGSSGSSSGGEQSPSPSRSRAGADALSESPPTGKAVDWCPAR